MIGIRIDDDPEHSGHEPIDGVPVAYDEEPKADMTSDGEDRWSGWDEDDTDQEEASDLDIDGADWVQTGRGSDFTKEYNKARGTMDSSKARGHLATPVSNTPATQAVNAQARRAAIQSHSNGSGSKEGKGNGSEIITDRLAELAPFASKVTLDPFRPGVSRKGDSSVVNREKDKSDRATTEQVLDPRTRIILFKLIRRNVIDEVNGVISTGKEAGVYHATMTSKGSTEVREWHLAIKIYKTSILTFKDRDRYVTGERRFKQGYSRHNPRKMVQLWAEKEMRNLKRLWYAGVPCPEPLLLRLHVLIMGLLGDTDGWACPRLKDAEVEMKDWPNLYRQMMKIVRRLYQECRLVHADLSEYNILYSPNAPSWVHTPFSLDPLGETPGPPTRDAPDMNRTPVSSNDYTEGTLYIIDVSQSVEHDHPHAQEFLKKDLQNVQDFFSKRSGSRVLNLRQSFQFVTSTIGELSVDDELDRLLSIASEDSDIQDQSDIFAKEYVPQSLYDVVDVERDTAMIEHGRVSELNYGAQLLPAAAVSSPLDPDPADPAAQDDSDAEKSAHQDSDDSEISGSSVAGNFETSQRGGIKNLDKDANRERKKILKEEAREKRKVKMSKSEKKRRLKKHSGKR